MKPLYPSTPAPVVPVIQYRYRYYIVSMSRSDDVAMVSLMIENKEDYQVAMESRNNHVREKIIFPDIVTEITAE
jgi:hypothetical protein